VCAGCPTGAAAIIAVAVPAVMMLGLHAAVANPYTRYNLILIGPFSVGAAWIISALLPKRCLRLRVLATGPRRTRSIAAGNTHP
jgi:hypothetical protein